MKCSICEAEGVESSRRSYCKICASNYQKKHYQKNKQYYKSKAAAHKRTLYKLTQDLKNKPCTDCNITYPSYIMDYDHRENKKYLISKMSNIGNKQLILDEIAKCDVVCSNCHRERTHKRKVASATSSANKNSI